MKTSLENESWVPCDIPYIYMHFIAFLCDFQTQNCEKDTKTNRITNYLNETNNFEEGKEFDFEENLSFSLSKSQENAVKIMKNELFIEENRFMLGNSTLILIKSLYDLLLIIQISPKNAAETVTKIFELIKVCSNNYSIFTILAVL